MKFTVIGLGSFGSNVAKTLYGKKHEVLAVDMNKERIEELKTLVVLEDIRVLEPVRAVDQRPLQEMFLPESVPDPLLKLCVSAAEHHSCLISSVYARG